jgi:hypothetical protein
MYYFLMASLNRSICFFCLFLFLMSAQPASAVTHGWTTGPGSKKLTATSLTPKMSSEEAYTERYSFAVDLDGGGHVGVDFTVSNLGWGDHHGGASVRVRMPGSKKYEYNKKVDDGEWTFSKSGFALNIASTSVKAKGKNTFIIKHNGRVKVDLKFVNRIPMWRPGNGQITVEDGYYAYDVIAPRAEVTGRIFINGVWKDVRAERSGYADHVATNIAPYDFAKRFSRFRQYKDDLFVIWREITLESDHGGKSLTWIMVGYKDQIVISDSNARLRSGKIKRDSKTKYPVPFALQVDGKRGGDRVKLVMNARKKKRKDLLASYGAAAKVVASSVSEPFRFDLACDYTLQMTIKGSNATVRGSGHYSVDFINH